MLTLSTLPSPAELVGAISSAKELEIETGNVKIKLALSAFGILLPAALSSAAAGNVTMKSAVLKAWPYIQGLTK